ncbi:gamma-glutamylcyclotransferase family protein [Streptomyces sp. NPDC088812]|uniref:gamma-glutamylcyclotransferase family protein n=1 Tax=Streptomyces sp. NPDC088812 TaxID=3365905 RepID=UPI0038165300
MSELPLFVYGSLSFDAVQRALLGRLPVSRPAAVTGWRNAALRDRPFPGLVPRAGSRVAGCLLTGLNPAERALLHAYEGPMYEDRALPLEGGGLGLAYVCTDASLVLEGDWDREHFGRELLPGYLAGVVRWLASRPDVPRAASAGGDASGETTPTRTESSS